MLNKLNNILERHLQIRMVKVQKPKTLKLSGKGSNAIIVEFAGSPAVGKTTLCNYYRKHHSLKLEKEMLVGENIDGYIHDFKLDLRDLQGIYKCLLSKIMESSLSASNKSSQIMRVLRYHRYFMRDYIITTQLNNKIVLLDEPLFHHIKEYSECFDKEKNLEETQSFLESRVYIACTASTDLIVDRLKKRGWKENAEKSPYGKVDEQRLREKIDFKKNELQGKVNKLKAEGAKVLELNTGDDLIENCKRIDSVLLNL